MEEPVKITELPHEILENILSYLTYDEIAKSREVCVFMSITSKLRNLFVYV